MTMQIVNMGALKIISILLIHHFIGSSCSVSSTPAITQKAQPRLDIYDEILRPPPPPPNLSSLRGQFSGNSGLRHQRQNIHQRPQFGQNQGSYGPPQYNQDRYPGLTTRPTQSPSFFQKVSSWLFTPDDGGQNNNYNPQSSYGAPSSHNAQSSHGTPTRLQQQPNKNKICSTCNQFPWIPVLRYQTAQKSLRPTADQFSFNVNSPRPGSHSNGGINYNGSPQNVAYQPTKISSPTFEKNNRYLPQKPINNEQTPSASLNPPTVYPGKPFSLAEQSLEEVSPASNGFSKPVIKNSYGTPIPPNSFGSPLPVTNDESDSHFTSRDPNTSDNIHDEHHAPDDKEDEHHPYNKEPFENLETNNVPLVSKINENNIQPKDIVKNLSSSGNNDYIPKPESFAEHNDDPFSHSVFPVANRFEQNRGIQILQPIPLPNLSPVHIPPIFNARPFRNKYFNQYNNYNSAFSPQESTVLPSTRPATNYPTQYSTNAHSYAEHSSVSDNIIKTPGNTNSHNPKPNVNFQLLQSIPLAEFTSVIEYPISIIQSPLVEIETTPENHQENGHGASHVNENINFNKNPIIVENESPKRPPDSHSAASGGNYQNSHDVDDVIAGNQFHFLPTPNSIDVEPTVKVPHQSISYSYIDQSFFNSNSPSSTPIPVHHKTDYPKYENKSPTPNIFKPAQPNILQSIDSPLLYLNPNVPHKDSKLFSRPVNSYSTIPPKVISNTFVTENIALTTVTPIQNQPTSTVWSGDFRNIEQDAFVPGRWPPPISDIRTASFESQTKKPKRIQIIIPYTSKNSPSPFKFSHKNVASTSGWVPMSEDYAENHGRKVPPTITENYSSNGLHLTNSEIDYHESSESKIVSSSAPSINSTKTYFNVTDQQTKNITENKNKSANKVAFDIKKLQQNIDEWTAQEYSKIYKRQQKASTITHLKRSKNIPEEYLTTTPSQKRQENTFLSSINDLNASLLDNEAAGSIQYSLEKGLQNETTEEGIRSAIYELNEVLQNTKKPYLTTKRVSKTTMLVETTTLPQKTTTKHSWEKIQTSISPLTKEKVYVVTPLPWNRIDSPTANKNRIVSTTSSPNTSKLKEEFNSLSFKSPRFLIRPTPGPTGSQREISFSISDDKQPNNKKSGLEWLRSINNLEETTTESWVSRNQFGLPAVTSYKPPDGSSVHTSSGHSKVVTVVTPSTAPSTQ